MESGEWKAESGKRTVESGKLKVESEKWKQKKNDSPSRQKERIRDNGLGNDERSHVVKLNFDHQQQISRRRFLTVAQNSLCRNDKYTEP